MDYDKKCPACREAGGAIVITLSAHTCNICWACREGAKIPILAHICGRSNKVGTVSESLRYRI